MANEVKAVVVTRPADALAPARRRMADHAPIRTDHDDGLPRWLVLIPVGPLVIAGLLVIALSRIVGAPPLPPRPSSSGTDAEVRVDLPVIDEIKVGETMMRLGLAFTR